MGWPTGWLLDASTGSPTDLNLVAATPKAVYANNIIAGNSTQLSYTASASAPTGWALLDFTNYIQRTNGGNTLLTNTSDVQLTAPFNYDNTVDFNPLSGSPAQSGSAFSDPKLTTWFTPVAYRGACDAGDSWWKTWTRFNY